jgi:ATP-dependent DNA helicase 2 subunit 1
VPFSVSPEEAARRLAIAKKLLNDAGVDPDTLSADQMNIFANQSPELQKDSVAMLAKYGAERLQIIHPNNKEKTASEQSSSSATPANNGTPMTTTTKELVLPELQASGKKGPGKGAAAKASGADGMPTKRKMAKSRVACFQCKGRNVKVSGMDEFPGET